MEDTFNSHILIKVILITEIIVYMGILQTLVTCNKRLANKIHNQVNSNSFKLHCNYSSTIYLPTF